MQSITKTLMSLNVLYAEDDELTRKNTLKTLSLFVGNVFEAANGADALNIFHTQNIHIVILDFVMPIVDGYTAALEIRKVDAEIPIIITSSFTDKEKLLSIMGFNLVSYLEKPLQLNHLVDSLKDSVDRLEKKGRLKISLCKNVYYDSISKQLIIDGEALILSKNEYQFLEILLLKRSSLVSIQEIEDRIYSGSVSANTLRNMVYRLRKKIPQDLIVTVKDIGYILKPL